MAICILFNAVIDIPLRMYKDLILEERYGFNCKDFLYFFKEAVEILYYYIATSLPFQFFCIYAINNHRRFSILLAVLKTSLTAVTRLNFDNKKIFLKDPRLSMAINNLITKIGFKNGSVEIKNVLTNHTVAYFTGFGRTKRIVFYNSLINRFSDYEILRIFCHELSHSHYNHGILYICITIFD